MSGHRGAHPADQKLFNESHLDDLRSAVSDLSWLLGRGYAPAASLKLAGDRYRLRERQRLAVARASCSDKSLAARAASEIALDAIAGERLLVDGFNLIITLEAALSGGVLIECRDGCIRDLSSVHGSYRSVEETDRAIELIGQQIASRRPASCRWLLDKPVSNSGSLAARIRERAARNEWPWEVEVVFNPDRELCNSGAVAVTSDSNILDRAGRWANLGRFIVDSQIPQAWRVDLRPVAI